MTETERREEFVRFLGSEKTRSLVRSHFISFLDSERREEFVRFLRSERSRDAVKSQFISFLHSDEWKRLLVVALAGPELAPILKEEFVRFLGSERSRDAVKSQFISFLHSDEGKRLLVELLKEALAGRELAPILKGAEKSLKNLAAEQVVSFRTDAEMELKESAASHTVELERKARKAAQDIAGQANRVYQDLRDHVSLHQAEMERKARKAAQDIAEVYQDFLDHLGSYRAEIVEAIKEQLSILIRKEIERHESIPDFSWYPPAFFKKVDSLELSAHTASSLKNSNIVYIGDLVQKTKNEMLHIPNFGPRSLNEIKEVLAQMGLHLGMELPGWPPDNIDELAKRFEEDNY